MTLSKRTRLILFLLGLLMVLISLAALAFAFQTPEHTRMRLTVVPTLLTPPLSKP